MCPQCGCEHERRVSEPNRFCSKACWRAHRQTCPPVGSVACQRCGRPMRRDRANPLCMVCASRCHCGRAKDQRADECLSCGMATKARRQWSGPQRDAIEQASRKASRQRRTRFVDLAWESFRTQKADGRRYAYYWDDQERRRSIYRYQWVWQQAHGPMPPGHDVHHMDLVTDHDDLGNLELLTKQAHWTLHRHDEAWADKMLRARGQQRSPVLQLVCANCGVAFERRASHQRQGVQRTYCSARCRTSHQR